MEVKPLTIMHPLLKYNFLIDPSVIDGLSKSHFFFESTHFVDKSQHTIFYKNKTSTIRDANEE